MSSASRGCKPPTSGSEQRYSVSPRGSGWPTFCCTCPRAFLLRRHGDRTALLRDASIRSGHRRTSSVDPGEWTGGRMSTDDRERQSINGSAVQGNDLSPFTREGAHPRRQARSVLLRSGAQAHQPATFRVHDAEETIGVAHTVMLVEFRRCRTVSNGPCLEGLWARPEVASWDAPPPTTQGRRDRRGERDPELCQRVSRRTTDA